MRGGRHHRHKAAGAGLHLGIAHIDAPRLDLRPVPLYEDKDFGYFRTHYYGGVRKYQWVAIPLALHGTVCRADGSCVDINIGEKPGDPVFCITDLLPHLAAKQNEKKLPEGITGENLNVLIASTPIEDKEMADRVKLNVLAILNEAYGITERDFTRAGDRGRARLHGARCRAGPRDDRRLRPRRPCRRLPRR